MYFITASMATRSLCSISVVMLLMSVEMRAQEKPDLTEMLKVARVSTSLSGDERTLAIRLAEQALRSNKLLPDRDTFLTLAQTHRNIEAEKKGVFERYALLIYYRYAGDLGILVYVNLANRRVAAVEQIPHFPAPLAPEELQRARELALNHPQLRKLLAPYLDRLTVESHLTKIPTPKDPRFGDRLVHLLFRVGPRYLTEQGLVLVDLTTREITIVSEPEMEGDVRKH